MSFSTISYISFKISKKIHQCRNENFRLEKGRLLIKESKVNPRKHGQGEEYNLSFIVCSTVCHNRTEVIRGKLECQQRSLRKMSARMEESQESRRKGSMFYTDSSHLNFGKIRF